MKKLIEEVLMYRHKCSICHKQWSSRHKTSYCPKCSKVHIWFRGSSYIKEENVQQITNKKVSQE